MDTIVEFEEGPSSASHLAVAMDITTAAHLEKKFDHIKDSIDRGELTKIKYFASEKIDVRGEKSNIPHVVIGVDRQTLYDVLDAWIRGDTRKLADHPVQIKILEETRLQLEAFKRYAEHLGKDKIVRVYEKAIAIITDIMSSKEISEKDRQAIEGDEMFKMIKNYAEEIASREVSAVRED